MVQLGGALALSACAPKSGSPLNVFDTAWSLVETEFYDTALHGVDWRHARHIYRPQAAHAADSAALYLDCLNPMLARLQSSHLMAVPPPHTQLKPGRRYALPSASASLLTREDEIALGLTLSGQNPTVIDSAAPTKPAYLAGLRRGDRFWIKEVRGNPHARSAILTIDNEPRSKVVNWTALPAPWVMTTSIDEVPVLRFDRFAPIDEGLISDTLRRDAPCLVIDLRRNQGGDLRTLARLVSHLLPYKASLGTLVGRRRRIDATARSETVNLTTHLAILVGPRSQSAAEIFAAVLRDHGRARLFGERTAGDVLLSETRPLPDQGRLQIPIWDYRRPSGTRLEAIGVRPDTASAATDTQPLPAMAAAWLAKQDR